MVKRNNAKGHPVRLIRYDYQDDNLALPGQPPFSLDELAPALQRARKEVLDDVELFTSGGEVPKEKQPLDAGFVRLPELLLEEYRQQPEESQIGRIQQTADRLAAAAQRVVVVGIGGSYMGAKALMESCCHPYHNQIAPTERGGRPELYFEGNNVDNDCIWGLLDLLGEEPFALVPISKSGSTLEPAAVLRQLLRRLQRNCQKVDRAVGELLVPVTGQESKLAKLAEKLGATESFPVPEGVGGRFSVLSAVGLFPAALLGIDLEALVGGAIAMNEHFRSAPVQRNVVLRYVAVCHFHEVQRGATIRVLSTWGKRLESVGWWYDQLLAESLGKQQKGATPITTVNTRDLHSRGQQHQQGRRDKLITNLIAGAPQTESLPIGQNVHDDDNLNRYALKAIPDIIEAALHGTNKAYNQDRRPTADITLPGLTAAAIGQLLQMMMLATVVEGRLIGINPYGQPGVEQYKIEMTKFLAGEQ